MSLRSMTVQYIGDTLYLPPLEREVKHIIVGEADVADWIRYEPIVSCRDCKFYFEADNYHPSGNFTSRCCKYFDSYMNEVEPDGFCAWGERRDA